ncbi:MAG: hypothetical protein KDA72_19085, partial [Planctomycetales bacterium]|nr:hypothetical protein [Planctomycetales bacterium]
MRFVISGLLPGELTVAAGARSDPRLLCFSLLDWTASQAVAGKRGVTPSDTPPILQRLGLEPDVWCELVHDFGTLFSLVAGRPAAIDEARTLGRQARFHTRPKTR